MIGLVFISNIDVCSVICKFLDFQKDTVIVILLAFKIFTLVHIEAMALLKWTTLTFIVFLLFKVTLKLNINF